MKMHEIRKPQFAGSFYSDSAQELIENISSYFREFPVHQDCERVKPIMALLPHAGHIFSGHVTAATIAEIEFAPRIIILCPNHQRQGKNFGVWPHGAWQNPIGLVPTDKFLSEKLMSENSPFVYDTISHNNEHAIEVLLPFLQYSVPILYIVPVSVSNIENAEIAAKRIAECIKQENEEGKEVTILVSSDMNHFANDEQNRYKDKLVLDAFLNRDPNALLDIVQKEKISMCGILPAVVGLLASNELGAIKSKLAAYDTSAKITNDTSSVVGYAGAYIW